MSHLAPEQLYAAIFDHTQLGEVEQQHVDACPTCRRTLGQLEELAQELVVARKSRPAQAALDRYQALFDEVERLPSPLSRVWQQISALLVWDSRRQLTLQGVRSAAAATAYRLLYATEQTEVELLVEPDDHHFRIRGEIIVADAPAPMLVQWLDAGGAIRYETNSNAEGQFAQHGIAPGVYGMSIVSASGPTIDIERLEIM